MQPLRDKGSVNWFGSDPHNSSIDVDCLLSVDVNDTKQDDNRASSERKIRSIFEHFRNVGSFVILISGACCCKLLLTLLLGHLFTKLFEITVMLLTV